MDSTEFATVTEFIEEYAKDNDRALEKLLKTSLVGSDYQPAPLSKKKQPGKRKAASNSGPGWFGLQSAPLTASNRRELEILQLQPYLMEQQRMKRPDRKGIPSFFQIGRVVEGAQEFYSSRIPKKQRQRSFIDELISDSAFKSRVIKKTSEKQKRLAVLGQKRKQLQQYHQRKRAKR